MQIQINSHFKKQPLEYSSINWNIYVQGVSQWSEKNTKF